MSRNESNTFLKAALVTAFVADINIYFLSENIDEGVLPGAILMKWLAVVIFGGILFLVYRAR